MSSTDKPTKDAFAQIMLAVIRKHDATPLRYDPDEFRLIDEGENKYYLNLSNAYDEYRAAASQADAERALERYCSVWVARHGRKPSAADAALPNLRPSIRLRSYYELTRLQLQPRIGRLPPPFPYLILGEHYALGLMHLQGNSLAVVAQHHLDEWELDFETALAAAMENLLGRTTEPLKQAHPGVWYGFWDDDFGPSRLLLRDALEPCDVAGDPVALLAERRVLLVTGADDEEGLLVAAQMAENLAEDGRPVGALPLRLHEGEWKPFLPPATSPAGKKVRLRWMKSQQSSYKEQAAALAAIGPGPVAGDYHIFPGREGVPPFSFCIWQQGVEALLPRADRVLFALPDEEGGEPIVRAEVRWERAVEVAGELMERQPELFPERWRVLAFPDAAQLAAARGASGA